MEPPLQLIDIANLFATATARIEWYWNLYVVMLIALIGWLVTKKDALSRRLKVTVTAGYIVFALMNVQGLWESYAFGEALRLDLLAVTEMQNQLQNASAVLHKHSLYFGQWIAIAIHIVLGILIIWVVWTDWLRTAPAEGPATEIKKEGEGRRTT